VIVLKDGGMLRGTIVEMDAKKDVTITLSDGKSRTVSMTDVEYAGPESERPARGQARPAATRTAGDREYRPMVTVDAKPARLDFTANGEDVSLHIKSGSAIGDRAVAIGYDLVCTAPCTATIPAGKHQLALSKGTRTPVAPKALVEVPGDSRVQGEYVSRSGTRAAGWALFGLGTAFGLVIGMSGDTDSDTFVYGTLIMLGSAAIGFPMAFTRDKVRISVVPATVSSKGTPRTSGAHWPGGIALSGNF